MYGGVSLAIYINGVTQELFRMVRSTAEAGIDSNRAVSLSGSAAAGSPNALTGTERVYRKLSYLTADKQLLEECQQLLASTPKSERAASLKSKLDPLIAANREINTRFIVDILTGTSAGGINAIYLGKALANNQRLDRLKELWISEGDLAVLLNDKRSVAGINLSIQEPPQSLLNSRRMYLKLLNALEDMDSDIQKQARSSPYVDELDLYITTTDIEGVPVPLRLSDMVVYERRHKNVFHFKYEKADNPTEDFNDFRFEHNPFLAFAARCTSSFPFAFEPMRLCDIDEVLEISPQYREFDCKAESTKWRRFFRILADPVTGQPNLRTHMRAFGDGGYLDNKPFSYAVDTLVGRHSDVPVDRKLIYIEPSPEHPEDEPEHDHKPDALENIKAALLDLPSYETIREDLQRILDRNQLIERVQRIISGTEKDVHNELTQSLEKRLAKAAEETRKESQENGNEERNTKLWSQKTLTEMVEQYCRYFLPYRRLRISSVTDDIASLVARLANFDEQSDLFLAVRCLVKAWRERTYYDNKQPTVNEFLWYYDFKYRIRRLSLLRNKLDQVYLLDETLLTDLEKFAQNSGRFEELIAKTGLSQEDLEKRCPELALQSSGAELHRLLSRLRLTSGKDPERERIRKALLLIKTELNDIYHGLRQGARSLRNLESGNTSDDTRKENAAKSLLEHINEIGLTPAHLQELLGATLKDQEEPRRVSKTLDLAEEDCFERAANFFEAPGNGAIKDRFDAAAKMLGVELKKIFEDAGHRCLRLLNPKEPFQADGKRTEQLMKRTNEDWSELMNSAPARAVRKYLGYYYQNFDDYDQISFPIFYEANVGETDVMEVIRISPEDACSLINERRERKESSDGVGRQKLAGTALQHFGAFLDRTWRQNDIMWGRLDGAERLIASLLPGTENELVRGSLIEEAHEAILLDEISLESRFQLSGLMTDALVRASAGQPIVEAISKVTGALDAAPVKTGLEAVMRTSLSNNKLLDFVRTGYEVNRKLDPQALLESISRSTQIIGKLFEDIANQNHLDGKSLAWIARLGQIFWGLVEVAVPNSLRHLLLHRWLQVIYVFEFFTIVAGLLLSSAAAQQFGWTAFGITALLNIIVLLLKDRMSNKHGVLYAAGIVLGVFLLFAAALGLTDISGFVFNYTVGKSNLHPREWLRQNVKPIVPQGGWWDYLPGGLWISGAILLIVLLNLVGARDFRWLRFRLRLSIAWLAQSRLSFILFWTGPKTIKLDALDLKKLARSYPDGTGTFAHLLPFHLSTEPPPNWLRYLEQRFSKLLRADEKIEFTAYSDQVWVFSPENQIESVYSRLKNAVAAANREYRDFVKSQSKEDYTRQRNIVYQPASSPLPGNQNGLGKKLDNIVADNSKLSGLTKWTGRLWGSLTLVVGSVIIYAIVVLGYLPAERAGVVLPAGLHMPGVALELVRRPQDVDQIVRAQSVLSTGDATNITAGVAALIGKIEADYWVILVYAFVLAGLCFWFARRSYSQHARNLTGWAGTCVLLAAGFDVIENRRMISVLANNLRTQDAINAIRVVGSLKWAALFIALGLLSLLFITVRNAVSLSGYFLLGAALLGFFSLILLPAIEAAFFLMGLSLVVLGLIATIWPHRFTPR
jgi:patatin-related protein